MKNIDTKKIEETISSLQQQVNDMKHIKYSYLDFINKNGIYGIIKGCIDSCKSNHYEREDFTEQAKRFHEIYWNKAYSELDGIINFAYNIHDTRELLNLMCEIRGYIHNYDYDNAYIYCEKIKAYFSNQDC